jgi:immunity protein 52 of polymorphic toxin system
MEDFWYHIDAFWTARHETERSCGTRLKRMLEQLGAIHPDLTHWFAGTEKRGAGSVPTDRMSPVVESLGRRLSEGIVRRDSDDAPIPELGYRVHAWNGIDSDRRSLLEVTAGALASGGPFANNVVLKLRKATATNADLITPDVLRSCLLCTVDAWEPDWAVLGDWDYWKQIQNPNTGQLPKVRSGWMTYLSASYARRITPPREVRSEAVKGGGLLLSATEELFSVDDPAHVTAADTIQAALAPLQ